MEILSLPDKRLIIDKNWEELRIVFTGDFQYDGPDGACHSKLLRRTIKEESDKGSYFLMLGDYVDAHSPSNRQRIAQANFYDSTLNQIDRIAQITEEELLDIMEPARDRVLGMIHGHHYHQYSTGETSDTRICKELGAVYLGSSAFVDINFKDNSRHKANLRIWMHHGGGGGQKVSSISNWLENRAAYFPDADILVAGHQHKVGAWPIPAITVRDSHIVSIPRWLIGSGSFLRGYLQGSQVNGFPKGNYVEQKGLPPVALGYVAITVRPTRGYEQLEIIPETHAY